MTYRVVIYDELAALTPRQLEHLSAGAALPGKAWLLATFERRATMLRWLGVEEGWRVRATLGHRRPGHIMRGVVA